MKKIFIDKRSLFYIIQLLFLSYYLLARASDCDGIKNEEDKKTCQKESIEKQIDEVESHEHTKWKEIKQTDKKDIIDDIMESR